MLEMCPAAFADEDGGRWGTLNMDGSDGSSLLAYYLGTDVASVYGGCAFAVVWVKRVSATEFDVLKKWRGPWWAGRSGIKAVTDCEKDICSHDI